MRTSRRWLKSAGAGAFVLLGGGCTAVLGIDQDYYLDGAGDTGGGGTGGGGTTSGACASVADCVAEEPECQSPVACEDGACLFDDTPDGAPISGQTAGDCAAIVCDGEGATRSDPLTSDVEDDGKECTIDTCDGGTPVHTSQDSLPCYSGPPGTLGIGVCSGGSRTCGADGSADDECVGEVVPAAEDCGTSLDDDCDGTINEDCPCSPDEAQPCYTGPAGTAGQGTCQEGSQTCNASGVGFGPCTGEVTPTAEDCDAGSLDQDCDGQADESGPSCVCGDGKVSNAEPCDGGGVDTAGCDADCTTPSCGDGDLNIAAGEQCEDGNAGDADDCSALCKEQKVLAVSGGLVHTCALLSSGVVKCWGGNARGQLGLGDTTPRGDQAGEMGSALPAVELGQPAKEIAAGSEHTCALLANDQVKCWGRNDTGALGLGDALDRGDQQGEMGNALPAVALGAGLSAKAISAGKDHTCARLSNDQVKCWGIGTQGELGLGDTAARGDQAGEMGDALPAVDLGPGVTTTSITAGTSVSCAGLAGGGLKCWGPNTSGGLGLGDTLARGDGAGEMGATLPVVSLGSFGMAITASAGADHACARLSNQTLKCWGANGAGQLGLGDVQNRGDQPGEMGDALPALGFQVGITVAAVTAGEAHTCALRSDGLVRCVGGNSFGQTGALPSDRKHQTVGLGAGLTAAAIDAGAFHTCAVVGSRLKCWGANGAGQLGLGDVQNRGDADGELGDALPFVKLWNDQW